VAYLADQYDSDKHYVGYRRVFVGILPGFIWAFFAIPAGADLSSVYGGFALSSGLSLALFHLLDTFLKLPNNRLTVLFGATAFTTYYWFVSETWFKGLSLFSGHWLVPEMAPWGVRLAVVALALTWVWRSFQIEDAFVEQTVQRAANQPAKLGEHAAAALKGVGEASQASVVIQPQNKTVPAQVGQSLLELIESCGDKIEAGCRMGVCGADPIAVRDGAHFLSPMGDDERNTLARLGHAPNTRMACSARLHKGCVHIALVPDKADLPAVATVREFDRAIQRVVIISNGIAGVRPLTISASAIPKHPAGGRGCAATAWASPAWSMAARPCRALPDARGLVQRPHHRVLSTPRRVPSTPRANRCIYDRETLDYDRLILATGNRALCRRCGLGGPAATCCVRQ
jgi:ferredoxin